jgi:hypothetical protein
MISNGIDNREGEKISRVVVAENDASNRSGYHFDSAQTELSNEPLVPSALRWLAA